MLTAVTNEDLDIIYELGLKYDSKFKQKYDLDFYLNNDLYILLAYKDNKIIKGFIICTILSKSLEILLIYVDEKFRNQGIGKILLKGIEESANDILLEVSVLNNIAINLYKKMGYDIISKRPKYYNGIDALVMKKVIKWRMYTYYR